MSDPNNDTDVYTPSSMSTFETNEGASETIATPDETNDAQGQAEQAQVETMEGDEQPDVSDVDECITWLKADDSRTIVVDLAGIHPLAEGANVYQANDCGSKRQAFKERWEYKLRHQPPSVRSRVSFAT